jgi:hypothetical protein
MTWRRSLFVLPGLLNVGRTVWILFQCSIVSNPPGLKFTAATPDVHLHYATALIFYKCERGLLHEEKMCWPIRATAPLQVDPVLGSTLAA